MLLIFLLFFLSKSELLINSEIFDLLTNYLFFCLCLKYIIQKFVIIRHKTLTLNVSLFFFKTKSLTLDISFLTTLRGSVVDKLAILNISTLISLILAL